MSNLVAVAYPDEATATEVGSTLVELQKEHVIELDDLVVAVNEDGKIKLRQSFHGGAAGAAGRRVVGRPDRADLPRAAAGHGGRRGGGRRGRLLHRLRRRRQVLHSSLSHEAEQTLQDALVKGTAA